MDEFDTSTGQPAVSGGVQTPPPTPREPRLPGIWNVPLLRNPYFVGRDALLETTHTALRDHHIAALLSPDSAGVSAGRTQLAAEFSYRFADDYEAIWWCNAAHPAVLASDCAEFAAALNLPGASAGRLDVMLDALRRHMESKDGWLVILDASPSAETLGTLLTDKPRGHILITADACVWPGPGVGFPVPPLAREHARALFRKRGRGLPYPPDGSPAAGILKSGNPLLLEVIAASAGVAGGAPPLFEDEAALEYDAAPLPAAFAAQLPRAVAHLSRTAPGAAELLALTAFLAPDAVSLQMLRDGLLYLPPPLQAVVRAENGLRGAAAALYSCGLVQLGKQAVLVHPAVQEAVRRGLPPHRRREWAAAAVQLLTGVFPFEEQYEHYVPACGRLLRHALAAAEHAERLDTAVEETGRLLNQLGLYLRGCSRFEDAHACYRRAVALGEQAGGPNDPVVAIRVNNLGVASLDLGDLEYALACFERAMSICQAAYGPNDAMQVMPIRNLCSVLTRLGDLDTARKWYRKALNVYLDVFGWNHSMVAECVFSLGNILQKQGRFDEARMCFEHAIVAEEHTDPCDKAMLARYLKRLGMLLLKSGDPKRAVSAFRRALDVNRELLGAANRGLVADLLNLARALQADGNCKDAVSRLEDALRLLSESEEDDRPRLVRVLSLLGKALKAAGEPRRAKECLERVLRLHGMVHGPDSPEVGKDLVTLGRACEDLGEWEGALDCHERALAIERQAYGPTDPRIATLLNRVGDTLQELGRLDEALERFRQALSIDAKSYGQNHPDVARDTLKIGLVLKDKGDVPGAYGNLMRAVGIYEAALGPEHPRTLRARDAVEELGG